MTLDRREFLSVAAAGAAATVGGLAQFAPAAPPPRFKAIVFDAFPIFDPRPLAGMAESLYPGRGADLSNAWRTRQFEYQWWRTLAGRYVDFWQTTEDGLVYAAKLLQLELTPEKQARLMHAYLELVAWPDVPPAIRALDEAGIRLALLSNMTAKMLQTGLQNAGLEGSFEQILSTDRIRAYKPDPRAYQAAIDGLNLRRDEILFAAYAGWDAAGAKWFGYPTFWVNRLNLPREELGVLPDATGRDLADLVRFVQAPG